MRRAILWLPLTAAIGCSSFSSTSLLRMDDNSFVGNSDGCPKLGGETRPFKGVPVTLSLPTHLDIYIEETYYLGGKAGAVVLEEAPIGQIRNVRTEVIRTKKVFVTDFKRPGAGSLNMTQTFGDDQYWNSIQSTINDQTIAESTKLLAAVLKAIPAGAKSAGAGDGETKPTYHKMTRVVAYQRFDINDPEFEQLVEVFVNSQLAYCD